MRRLLISAFVLALPTQSLAQDRTVVVEPVPPSSVIATIDAPIEYDENGVVKAQHFKPSDLTPEQYQALLAEADKIRLYRQSRQAQTISTDPAVAQIAPVVLAPSMETPGHQTSLHTVQTGDTLYNIAKRYNVSVTSLQQVNGIQGSAIALGQSLAIPAPKSAATPVASVVETVRDGVVTRRVVEPVPEEAQTRSVDDVTTQSYAVLKKDTLYAISRRTCVDVASLIAINGITNPNALTPGQKLDLPETHCLTR